MGELNGKCDDGVEMMIENNIPSSFFLLFFFLEGKYVGNTSK